ncbi:MAG: hypothetical protein IJ724_07015 [Muribaculaceae bacterium]|nr:hypothetical protein [Muribaculaceae bacterium]
MWKNTIKYVAAIARVYGVMLLMLTAAIVAVYCIPLSALRDNVDKSIATFEAEGSYPTRNILGQAQLDNFTDCYMLQASYCTDDKHPVRSAMEVMRCRRSSDIIADTRQYFNEGDVVPHESMWRYGKYWHGYQVVLRPLLTVTDYQGIRTLNWVLLSALLAICLVQMWRIRRWLPLCFLFALLVVKSGVVPLSMQYSNCYYIMLVSTILIMTFDSLTRTPLRRAQVMFAIGAVTAFSDFFTVPTITLGVPLATMMLKRDEHSLRQVLGLCAMWGLGWLVFLVSKWPVAMLLAGYNPLHEVGLSIVQHTVNGEDPTPKLIWVKSIISYGIRPMFALKVVAAVLLLAAAWMAGKGRQVARKHLWLWVLALVGPVWMLVFLHHAYWHHFISLRSYLTTWYVLPIFMCLLIDWRALVKRHR